MSWDIAKIRQDFPVLAKTVYGKPLVYLDNANTTQKPQSVLESMRWYLEESCANIHRGTHFLSQQATDAYESTREKVRKLINAKSAQEIVFTKGTTEAINLVAQTFGRRVVGQGDEIIVSTLEHHSNIVPWQLLCEEKGAKLRVAPINDAGELIVEEFQKLLNPKTKFLALAHVSNALGTINPIKELIAMARAQGVAVLIDGAQALPHLAVDVQDLDCDFYAFSGHKMYAPTGVGVLFGKKHHLDAMPPYQTGGNMIAQVTFEKTTFAEAPAKFEAGTPNIAGVIGLGAAVDYLEAVGLNVIEKHEQELLAYATSVLNSIAGLRLIGTATKKAGVLSFAMDGVHPHDVGTILDRQGIAIRAGHLCAQPTMRRFGVPALCRASLGIYNTRQEIDVLAQGLKRVREVF